MNKLDPTQITKAPLMAKSERMGSTEALSIYLNNQTDVVHALLVHFGHVHDTARDARILDFDDHGFDVEYTLPDSDEPEADQRTRIDFKKPITRWADLRPTMLAMREEAKTALQVPRNPLLPTFKTPDLLPELFVVLVLLLFQAFFAVASPTSPLPVLRRLADVRVAYIPGGMATVKGSYVFLVAAHGLESIWFFFYLRREGSVKPADLRPWILWTLAFGLVTTWPNYQRALQRERIAGIYARVQAKPKAAPRKVEGKKKR